MKYQHIHTGRILTIRKLFGPVAYCEGEPRRIPGTLRMESEAYICLKENLIPYEAG